MTITECANILRENDDFLLITHARPDGDTLCSAAALCSALRRAGKSAHILTNAETTEKYEPLLTEYVTEGRHDGQYIVSVDLANVNLFPKGFDGEVMLSIDHHSSNGMYARQTYVDSKMAACGEIIMELIELLCGEIALNEAELLYIAISTDCGCFCFGNTNARTLRDAARLIELGVNNGYYNKCFFRSFTRSRIVLEGMIYSTLKTYRNDGIVVAIITQDMMERSGATENDCDDLASLPGKVQGCVVAITVRELGPGRSKASVRTNSSVNACEICSRFGGGGHFMASGCTADMGPYELAEKLAEVADEVWK
jgi:phosphoesterase RecJ-like protein